MTPLFRLAVLVLALAVGVAPASGYVLLANGDFDQHYIYRDTGAAGLTTGEYTVTWQQWIVADRPAKFQTYYSIGPTSFSGTNYDVTFDGDGGTSNNMAVGAEGGDVYSAVLPVVGSWKQMGFRRVDLGGGNFDHIFYYDLAAGTANKVTRNATPTPARAWDATTRLIFSNDAWAADQEGTNGRYRCAKLWERLLTEADTQTEAASCSVQTSSTNLWGMWTLCANLLDTSGNGRNLSAQGTNSFTADEACGSPGYILTEAGDCINAENSNRLITEAGAGIGPCVASAGRFRTLMGVGQ